MNYSRCIKALLAMVCVLTLSAAAMASRSEGGLARPEGCSDTAAPALWKTVAASGDVEARPASAHEEAWQPLRRGDELAPRSQVRAFQRARATLTRQGDVILVSPGSDLVLPEKDSPVTVIEQSSGKALYKVAPRYGMGGFQVHTPYLIAGVKGTQFSVMIRDGSTAVSVLEGHVEVHSVLTGEREDLFAGEIAIVSHEEGGLILHRESSGSPRGEARKEDPQVAQVRKETERMSDRVDADLDLGTGSETGTSVWEDLSGAVDLPTTRETNTDPTKGSSDPVPLPPLPPLPLPELNIDPDPLAPTVPVALPLPLPRKGR